MIELINKLESAWKREKKKQIAHKPNHVKRK
jgi:hypothetical protein